MIERRREKVKGGTYCFTVNCTERCGNSLLVDYINLLRNVFRKIKTDHPFAIEAMVVLPEHLHCIWTLPPGADYKIWALIKAGFFRGIFFNERRSENRMKRGEPGVWNRRYWEHLIRNEEDFQRHVDYFLWNPLKHSWVRRVNKWPYSSYHANVRKSSYSINWVGDPKNEFDAGE